MGEAKKTVSEIRLAGNAGKHSRAELLVRAKEEREQQPVQPANCRPKLPKHLCADAVVVWKQTLKLMRARGTLSAGDAPILQVYAEVSARWIAAKRDLAERGIIVRVTRHDKQGAEYSVEATNPCLAIVQDCERQMLSHAKALGLTPDSRERVKPAKTKDSDAGQAVPGSVAAMFPDMFKKGR